MAKGKEVLTGWEEEAARVRVGEKIDLESLPGYWIRPVKYSVDAAEEINGILISGKKSLPKDVVQEMMKYAQEGVDSAEEILKKLPPEMVARVTNSVDMSTVSQALVMRKKIQHGLGPNNLGGGFPGQGALAPEGISETMMDKLMQYSAVANEMIGIIAGFNRPLGKGHQRK